MVLGALTVDQNEFLEVTVGCWGADRTKVFLRWGGGLPGGNMLVRAYWQKMCFERLTRRKMFFGTTQQMGCGAYQIDNCFGGWLTEWKCFWVSLDRK